MLKKDDVLKVVNELGGCDATEDYDKGHDQAIGAAYYAVDSMEPKTVTSVLEGIANEICDSYCKWPEMYGEKNEDLDGLYKEHCDNCPLSRL